MKKKNIIILIFISLCFSLTVHSQSLNHSFFIEEKKLYERSVKELRKKNFDIAITILEKIKKNNITGFNNDKIIINLIYAYYKNFNFNMAKKSIEEFIYFYPNHPNMDYVIYIQCLINIDLDKHIFFKILPINYYNSDPSYGVYAFSQLKKFIHKYPKSLYVINAKKNLICLKNRLSEYDFSILKFYYLNKEYIAVINRGEEILQNYSETLAARKALIYMKKSYIALKIFKTAEKISKIISLNKI